MDKMINRSTSSFSTNPISDFDGIRLQTIKSG